MTRNDVADFRPLTRGLQEIVAQYYDGPITSTPLRSQTVDAEMKEIELSGGRLTPPSQAHAGISA